MQIVIGVLAILAISYMITTPESRAKAKQELKPYERGAWILTALIWAALIFL